MGRSAALIEIKVPQSQAWLFERRTQRRRAG